MGLLVYNMFNASILRPQIPESWRFVEPDYSQGEDNGHWQDDSGRALCLGDKMSLRVVGLAWQGDLIAVEASPVESSGGAVGAVDSPDAERTRRKKQRK